jgi:hypothetical protein
MQLLKVSTLPIYLPYDEAHVPFGDPFEDASITSSATGLVTAPGYDAPAVNDKILFSDLTAGAIESAGLSVQTVYYVAAPISGDSFAIASVAGGGALGTTAAVAAGAFTLHLISDQVDGVPLPFKPNNTALAVNLGANPVTLMGAPDKSNPQPGTYSAPQGPGTLSVIATVPNGAMVLVTINNDWIQASASGTLYLIQN